MIRARKMCQSCPFRLRLSVAEKRDIAKMTPEQWPCHAEAGYTTTEVQCRGHWEVKWKYGARKTAPSSVARAQQQGAIE